MKKLILPLRLFGKGLVIAIATSIAAVSPLFASRPNSAWAQAQPTWYNCLTREVWLPKKQIWCHRLTTLQAATYPIPDQEPATLSQGLYENEALRYRVELVNQEGWIAFGDVDGDGAIDGVAVLVVNSGGTGNFRHLVVMLDVDGSQQVMNPLFVGDRVQINRITPQQSQITVNLVTQGPDDSMCCPTQTVTRIYRVQPPEIVQIREVILPPLPSSTSVLPDPEANKIGFDLSQLNEAGLYGPPDGLRTLQYEFCIPAEPGLKEQVTAIDPTLTVYSESPGRIGCQSDELLCIGHTGQPNFRDVLAQLAALPEIQRIEQAWFE
jgi:hypothetical protein